MARRKKKWIQGLKEGTLTAWLKRAHPEAIKAGGGLKTGVLRRLQSALRAKENRSQSDSTHLKQINAALTMRGRKVPAPRARRTRRTKRLPRRG